MPYNPGTEYRGDRYLFAGIAGAGDALAKGIQTWRANRDESRFLDSQAEGLAQAALPWAKSGAIDPKTIDELAKFPSLSLSQKRGKLSGIQYLLSQAQRNEEAQATQARHEDAMNWRRAEVELKRGELLRKIAQGQGNQAGPMAFEEDPITGARFARAGNTTLPSGINPERAPTLETLTDPKTGDPIGYRVPVGNGRTEFQRMPQKKDLSPDGRVNAIKFLGEARRGAAMAVDGSPEQQAYEEQAAEYERMLGITPRAKPPKVETPAKGGGLAGWWMRMTGQTPPAAAPAAEVAPPPAPPAPADGLVEVISPDGKRGRAPAARLAELEAKGFRRAQ